jgi:molybdate-binding protein
VARYVKTHPAYAGVGIRPVAAALNLPFASWAEEPFEWVTRRDAADDARIRLFEHWLRSPAVKAGLDRMPGVASYSPGQLIDPSSV